jgi:hypothetical protein
MHRTTRTLPGIPRWPGFPDETRQTREKMSYLRLSPKFALHLTQSLRGVNRKRDGFDRGRLDAMLAKTFGV